MVEREMVSTLVGYLPVPLKSTPPESLSSVNVYLANGSSCSLYSSSEGHFGKRDAERLLKSGVEFVYVSVDDHVLYYRTMESIIQSVMDDPNLRQQKKSEILYATSLELANQLCSSPPGKQEVSRASKMVQASVHLILKDGDAFGSLFEVFGHDFYTATHMVNVCTTALALAHKLGLGDVAVLHNVGIGSLLHDIGKVFIPGEILNCREQLTNSQYDVIRTHVELGCDHLRKVTKLPEIVLQVVAEHHERLDGSGYPRGLKGKEISAMGRLAAIVDTFDAMTSVRPYRHKTFTVAEALEELDSLPDHYDRELVHAFTTLVEQTVAGGTVEVVSGRNLDASGAKHLRYYFRLPAMFRRLRRIEGRPVAGPEEPIIAHHISCTRVGFLASRPVGMKECILFNGPAFAAVGLKDLAALVTRCRDHEDGWYTVEAEFLKPRRAEEIEQLRTVTTVREVSLLAQE